MSESRISELKNKLIKVQEESLQDTQKTFRSNTCIQSMGYGYAKRVYETETSNWHKDWKIKYLRDASIG